MVNPARRRFLTKSAPALVSAAVYVLIGPANVLAAKGKDDLHDLDKDNGGRGDEIDDRCLRDEGGRGQGSDNSGRYGRSDDEDFMDLARKELKLEEKAEKEAEKKKASGNTRRRRYSDPLYPDRERF